MRNRKNRSSTLCRQADGTAKNRNVAAHMWVLGIMDRIRRSGDLSHGRAVIDALVSAWPELSTAGRALRGVKGAEPSRLTLANLGHVVRAIKRHEWRVDPWPGMLYQGQQLLTRQWFHSAADSVVEVNLGEVCHRADNAAVTRDGASALAILHAHRARQPSGRLHPILPRIMVEERQGSLPVVGPWRARRMPLFPEVERDAARVAILELVDATGVPFRSKGRAAALEAALLVEAMFDLEINDRTGMMSATIPWTVGGLKAAMKPNGSGRYTDRPEDWARIAEALRAMDGASVPYIQPSGRVDAFKVFSTHLVPSDDAPDTDDVVVNLTLPPGTGPGPIMDRAALRQARLVASTAWRQMIGVHSVAWVKGKTRRPLGPGRGGLWIGNASRYPVVSAADRRRIIYGEGTTHKAGRVDAEWRKRAEAAGVAILDEDAVQENGKHGWRAVPEAAAEAISKRDGNGG